VEPDQKYISPNHDGVQDYVLFGLSVEDRSRIKGWKLQILDQEGKIVRDYRMSERDVIRGLTFKGFFQHLFSKRTSLAVPGSVMWDGTDPGGSAVKDGKYGYSFTAWDERDNIAAASTGVIIVDSAAPAVSLSTESSLFSPNNDGKKDEFIIVQNVTSAPEDKWEAGFRNAAGQVVKSYSWEGDRVPARLFWNGKDEAGADVPEGLYYYFIGTSDRAGNRAQSGVKEITLTRQYEIADIRMERDRLSYIRDRELRLYPSISNSKGLQKYSVIIMDAKRNPVREIGGERELPGIVTWNCLDQKGEKLDDGEYYIRLVTAFASGNTPASFEKKIIVDSTPPDLNVSHSPDVFSPDGDEENDVLTIKTGLKEQFGLRDWKIEIRNPSGILFKTFSGTGDLPAEIRWDGLGDNRDIVESAVDYDMVLSATDSAGNSSKTGVDRIAIDILVIVTERGLKMRISNIQFAFDSARLMPQGMKILDRVSQILEKYERYDVIIEGHTDDIGKEDYNLDLSERRAKSVNDYLIGRGTARERLQFVGMGESVPLYANDGEENRRRNRRVEFLLIKKEQ
jgi:outer membrane protein OmpA-like peptidoglycan-associated protein/flagellar hook assembly protein FlgD